MIRFYGAPMSSAARCHWLLEELSIPYEFITVNPGDGSTQTPEFLRINPSGKIPAIQDDGFVLFESLAINYYLAEKYQPALMGDGQQARALGHQWSLWALTNLQPHPLNVLLHSMLLPEAKRDAASAKASAERAEPLLRQLETVLAGKQYIVCDSFTVADINVASVVVLAQACGLVASYPHISAWVERLASREPFRRAFPR